MIPAPVLNGREEAMVRYEAATVVDYLGALAPERRGALETLRSVVFQVAPDAVETMRHGMPVYDVEGREICLFASQKRHVSLYVDPRIVEKYRRELEGLSLGKSCVRFRNLEKLPLETIEGMLQEVVQLLRENDGKG